MDLDLSKSALYSAGFDQESADRAIDRYKNRYPTLFAYIEDVLVNWYKSGGNAYYFLNQVKNCPVSEWLKFDLNKIRQDKQARVAVNTLNQNSVGLLMKAVYAEMYRDAEIREFTTQQIPIFDAFYMLVDVRHLSSILSKLQALFTPILTNGDFSLRMSGEWKISDKSLGELQHFDFTPITTYEPKSYPFFS